MQINENEILKALTYLKLIKNNFHTQTFQISPQDAAAILERNNTKNRPLNLRRCLTIAESIKRGEWQFNGDIIRFGKSGQLLDGQHRLKAIVLAEKTVKSLACFNLEDEVFHTIDVDAKARTASDVLAMENYTHYTLVTSALRTIMMFDYSGLFRPTNQEAKPSATQILQFARQHDKQFLEEIARMADRRRNVNKFIGTTFHTAFYYLLTYRINPAYQKKDIAFLREQFLDKLEKGSNLEFENPILQLREKLISFKSEKYKSVHEEIAFSYFIKAFHLYANSLTVKNLRISNFNPETARKIYQTVFAPKRESFISLLESHQK